MIWASFIGNRQIVRLTSSEFWGFGIIRRMEGGINVVYQISTYSADDTVE
jgi:hypothetical protein